jgi:hypothetical protein
LDSAEDEVEEVVRGKPRVKLSGLAARCAGHDVLNHLDKAGTCIDELPGEMATSVFKMNEEEKVKGDGRMAWGTMVDRFVLRYG